MGTIIHESVHACDDILKYIHHDPILGANEVNAYLAEHIVQVILALKN